MSNWYRSNQAIGIYLAVALAGLFAYIWMSPWAHRQMRDGFMLGFFPMLGAASMLLFALAMVFDPLRREVTEDIADFGLRDLFLALVMLFGIAIYFAAMREIGFVLVTPVFMFVYMYWFGLRPMRLLLTLAVAIPLVTYLLFSLLGVRLPNGIVPPLF